VEFFALAAVITTKFMTRRGSFMHSIAQDSEALFLSAVLLSFGSILIGAYIYGHPAMGSTLEDCLRVMFWIYACLSYAFGLYIYMLLFTKGSTFLAPDMTSCWALPMFPAILVGRAAGIIGSTLDSAQRFTILICGVTFQGLGTLGSLFRQYHTLIILCLKLMMTTVTAIFVFRLFQSHLPQPAARPSLFFVVGPPAFTGVGLIQMAAIIPEQYSYFAKYPEAVQTLQTIALFTAIFFWTLAFWFCSLALVAIAASIRKTTFNLMWYATIFPNVGLVVSMLAIGRCLNSNAIGWVGTGATIVMAVIWMLVQCFHVIALWRGRYRV
jgi:tellurite resistance protein TehA-like permease